MTTKEVKHVPLLCSTRFGLSFILFLGYIMMYALRVNLSVAMVCMVNHTALFHIQQQEAALVNTTLLTGQDHKCGNTPASVNGSDEARSEEIDGSFVWPKEIQGLLLGSFFWGYLVTQVPGGWIAAKYGGKHVFGWGMFVTAIATLLTPVGSRYDYRMLIVLRFVAGLGEGVLWPATNAIWGYWAPPMERSKLNGFTNAGAQLGNVITLPLAGLLCQYGFDGGWPSIFYVLGAVTVVWFIAYMFIVTDRPETNKRISEEEKLYIQTSLLGHTKASGDRQMKVPWKAIFTSVPFLCLLSTHFCALWGTYMFLTNIPTYMREVLKLNIKTNGFFSAIPYVGMWIMINVSGFVADTLRSKGIWTTTTARKVFNSMAQLMPALMCVGLGYVDCTQPALAITLLTIGVSFLGCLYGAGLMVNHVDIAPKYAGILFGITNSIGSITGFLAPYTVGILTTHHLQSEWRKVFFIATAIFILGAAVFIYGGSGELQPWAKDEQEQLAPPIEKKVTSDQNDAADEDDHNEPNHVPKTTSV